MNRSVSTYISYSNYYKYRYSNMPIEKATYKFLKDLKKNNNHNWFADNKADFTKAQYQWVMYRLVVLKKAFEGELTKARKDSNLSLMVAFSKKIKKEKEDTIKSKLISRFDYFPDFEGKELTYKTPKNFISLPYKTSTSNNKYAIKRGPFGSALKKERING